MAIATEQNQGESNAALSNGLKLLITTQAVDLDDPILGFFHRWIELFAAHCESVIVLCLKEGRHALPTNVRVISLGKEAGRSRFAYLRTFYRTISQRTAYDAVFVHMNPEYVMLGGLYWRIAGKRIGLWYTHKAVNFKLRVAALLANIIFSASKESFRLPSKKIHITGHGIEVPSIKRASSEILRIITVGRISPTKRVREMFTVLDELARRGKAFSFRIVGAPAVAADQKYFDELKRDLASRPYASAVSFAGGVPHEAIANELANADVFLHMSTTGSLDKAVLGSLAAGVPVVTTSEAFANMPVELASDDPSDIVDALARAMTHDPETLSAYVASQHSLEQLIGDIIEMYAELR